MKTVIVGGGVAGLVCARKLREAGKSVSIYEASDGVGGRVRSDVVEGFVLDRGFQVLFTAYPAARKWLHYHRLNLQRFEPGAVVCLAANRHILSDPLRNPSSLIPSVLSTVVSPQDKIRTALLSVEMQAKSINAIMNEPGDETTLSFLRRKGFSKAFIQNFARPFFRSIFLESNLQTSAKAFQFDWKMLASGDTVLPSGGMGQISLQLAEPLQADNAITLNAPVTDLMRSKDGKECLGIKLKSGEVIKSDRIVLATPAPETARLLGQAAPASLPLGQNGTTTVYLASDKAPVFAKKIALHANFDPFVGSVAQLDAVAPAYVPTGKHLLAASMLGVPGGDDKTLARRALSDLRRMAAGDKEMLAAIETYSLLRVYRLPYGQFPQPCGVYANLPENADSGVPGVILAGEYTAASSFNAAMHSGEKAADLLLQSA